jgi:hypothetical protein
VVIRRGPGFYGPRLRTFKEFWPVYLEEHSHPGNRALHFLGSLAVLALVAGGVITGRWLLVAVAPVAGFGLAWVGHFGIQRNVPDTLRYPIMAPLLEWKMFVLMITGRLKDELRRHRIEAPTARVQPGPRKWDVRS